MPGPLHPVEQTVTVEAETPDLVPLPSLDSSDDYFKLELANVFGDALESMLVQSGMIEKQTAEVWEIAVSISLLVLAGLLSMAFMGFGGLGG